MFTIPGIHLLSRRSADDPNLQNFDLDRGRHEVLAGLGDWLSARVDSRYPASHTKATDACGVTILLEGYLTRITDLSASTSLGASDLLVLYLNSGLACLPRLRGSYNALILDRRTNQAHLFNDRRASRPLHIRTDSDGAIRVGPEVACLARTAPALSAIDPVAVCEFVLFASYYYDRTLFPSIRKMLPATVITFAPDRCSQSRYWEISIDPERGPGKEDDWIDQAVALIDTSTRALVRQARDPFIFLSGGADSRVILACLRQGGLQIPAVSYGTLDGDDAPIAAELARVCDIALNQMPIAIDDFPGAFVDAAVRSDCRSEMVDCPTLGSLHDRLACNHDLFLHGDKSFYGKHVAATDAALREIEIISLQAAKRFGDMLDPSILKLAKQSINAEIERMRASVSHLSPEDSRDKLYYEQSLFNLQNGFAAAKLRRLEQGQPWLDEDLVDLLFRMPGSLRAKEQRLPRKMLDRIDPMLSSIRFANRDSIPHPQTFRVLLPQHQKVTEFIRNHLIDQLDERLRALFRTGELQTFVESMICGANYPAPAHFWWHRIPGTWRLLARRYRTDRIHPVQIMLRLLQLNLYMQTIQ